MLRAAIPLQTVPLSLLGTLPLLGTRLNNTSCHFMTWLTWLRMRTRFGEKVGVARNVAKRGSYIYITMEAEDTERRELLAFPMGTWMIHSYSRVARENSVIFLKKGFLTSTVFTNHCYSQKLHCLLSIYNAIQSLWREEQRDFLLTWLDIKGWNWMYRPKWLLGQ